jgi:hypothetical protein
MENNFVGKCSMEIGMFKTKQRCLVRNKIKHQKAYKIEKALTPLGKISIVL